MNTNIKKILVSGLVASTVIAAFGSAPAQAKFLPPIVKPFPHPHHGFGGWGAAGLFTGLALGVIAVRTASSYDCGTIRQAVVDEYGNIVGYRYRGIG
jgi:hypothetical protein